MAVHRAGADLEHRVSRGVVVGRGGGVSSGLLALLTSRASSRIVESISWFDGMDEHLAKRLAVVSGCVAGLMLAFSGFMWSQAVIVEVYTLSVLSLMGVLCCLYRWTQDTSRMRYLYWSFFWFGICLCNHQTLIVAAMGIETAILFAHPRLGREFLHRQLDRVSGDSYADDHRFDQPVRQQHPDADHVSSVGLSFLLVSGFLWMATVVKAGEGITPDWREELRDGVKVVWSGLAYAGARRFTCTCRWPR